MRSSAIAMTCVLVATAARAAPAAPAPPGPIPTALVVGVGQLLSPIVSDLDRAVAFYRDGLGLDVQGATANADTNPACGQFGLPDAQLRWQIGRPAACAAASRSSNQEGRRQGPGAAAADIGATTRSCWCGISTRCSAPETARGAVVTKGGAPLFVPGGARKSRAVIVQDPTGTSELFQPDPLPEAPATPAPNVIEVRVRLSVADVERETRLYRDALGLAVRAPGEFAGQPTVLDMMGLPRAPVSRLDVHRAHDRVTFELIDFKGVERRVVRGNVQDPGSTRMQLQVRDVDAAIAALGQAGGRSCRRAGRRWSCQDAGVDDQGRHRPRARHSVPGAAPGGCGASPPVRKPQDVTRVQLLSKKPIEASIRGPSLL